MKRAVEELRASTATAAAEKKRSANREDGQPVDPVLDARRDWDRQLRALADQAHGVNLDLGAGLLTGLSTVDPADMNVARFFVFALLGADHDGSPYTQAGERVARVAAGGIRLLVEELRVDVTKTLKDGSRGRLRIDYGDTRDPEAAVKWLWRFIDAAGSAGELYGRALVVLAAEQHACRLVLPASQRSHLTHWAAHRDHARKALKKLAAPHLPASLKQLEKAVARAHADYEQTEAAAHNQRGPDDGAEVSESATAEPEIAQVPEGADEDDVEVEDSGDWDRELAGASDGHTVHSDADPGP